MAVSRDPFTEQALRTIGNDPFRVGDIPAIGPVAPAAAPFSAADLAGALGTETTPTQQALSAFQTLAQASPPVAPVPEGSGFGLFPEQIQAAQAQTQAAMVQQQELALADRQLEAQRLQQEANIRLAEAQERRAVSEEARLQRDSEIEESLLDVQNFALVQNLLQNLNRMSDREKLGAETLIEEAMSERRARQEVEAEGRAQASALERIEAEKQARIAVKETPAGAAPAAQATRRIGDINSAAQLAIAKATSSIPGTPVDLQLRRDQGLPVERVNVKTALTAFDEEIAAIRAAAGGTLHSLDEVTIQRHRAAIKLLETEEPPAASTTQEPEVPVITFDKQGVLAPKSARQAALDRAARSGQ